MNLHILTYLRRATWRVEPIQKEQTMRNSIRILSQMRYLLIALLAVAPVAAQVTC
jgi:hypothetical protein